jgi:drug/metabolite transporter (DMT)-like permease
VLGRKIQQKEAKLGVTNVDVKFTFLGMVIASVVSAIPLPFVPEGATLFQYSLNGWVIILLLGFITTGWGTYVFFVAVKKIEVSQAISLAYIKPVITIILAYFLLSELPTYALLVGIPIIFASILVINWRTKTEQNGNSPPPPETIVINPSLQP